LGDAWIDARYSTRKKPDQRLHLGSSAGGRAAFYVGLERPDMVRNVAMLSPSFVGSSRYFAPLFGGRRRLPSGLRVWLSAGTYEESIYEDAKVMERFLAAAGISVHAIYGHEGHSFGFWRRLAADVLTDFFPAEADASPTLPTNPRDY
jgi:enterochelin esterase-like enzyme